VNLLGGDFEKHIADEEDDEGNRVSARVETQIGRHTGDFGISNAALMTTLLVYEKKKGKKR
jgi:hypothetical protein